LVTITEEAKAKLYEEDGSVFEKPIFEGIERKAFGG
jgi:hypothetical protein